MIIDKSFAKRIEDCIKRTQVIVTNHYCKSGSQGSVFNMRGGAACFFGETSFFSQVVS